jgi:hypothetical protein
MIAELSSVVALISREQLPKSLERFHHRWLLLIGMMLLGLAVVNVEEMMPEQLQVVTLRNGNDTTTVGGRTENLTTSQ